ncbi:DUF4135 domain-containing protein [Achromobacter spanius]|uniref:DUF4135 domain-containing protein n=1 Tax=Achromobacter spanius TaxID=217203 RepID=UPI00320AEB65
MPIELGTFQSFVDSNPQADRLALGGTADQQEVKNARSGNMLTWAVKVMGEYTPWQWNAVTAQNNDAITAFRNALTAEFGEGAAAHAPASGTGRPLTSRSVNAAVHDAKAAIFEAAIRNGATDADRKAASDLIMRGVKLTPGSLGPMMEAEVSKVLLGLLPTVMPLDGTPRLDLIGKLGTQLVTRLEDHFSRGLEAYAYQKDATDHAAAKLKADTQQADGKQPRSSDRARPTHPSVDTLIARLHAQGDPMAALEAAVPALRVHLDAEIKGFETSVKTLLSRVATDHAGIGARFLAGRFLAGPDAGRLTDIQLTNSDPHKGGNRVAILSFEAGLKVVYKPRDVRIDDAISGSHREAKGPSLMQQAGASNSIYKFMPMSDAASQADSGDYGYVQHLPNREGVNHLVDASQAPEMFRELGRATAALMLAGATDIHHENLMVSNGGIYFTDLEFALNKSVMNELLGLLGGTPARPAEAPAPTMERLMEAIMLDKALTWATDNSALRAERPLENGKFEFPAMFQDVPESLLIIKTGNQYVNNRYATGPDSIYKPYGAAFGEGLASGLIALKRQDGLTHFLQGIQGMHLRFHPLATPEQRQLLEGVFHQDYYQELATPGPKPAQELRGKLQALSLLADDAGKRAVLETTMQASYAKHDIPYYSRIIGDQTLYPDGQPSQNAGCVGFFPPGIDAHADDLNMRFQQAQESDLSALGTSAGKWLSAQAPAQESAMANVQVQESKAMIQAVMNQRP